MGMQDQAVTSLPVNFILADAHGVGTVTGTGIDLREYESLIVVFSAGLVNTAGDLHFEESDVLGSGYTDITGAVFTQITTANDNAVYLGHINLRKRKPFIRAVLVVTGTAHDAAVVGVATAKVQDPVGATLVFDV